MKVQPLRFEQYDRRMKCICHRTYDGLKVTIKTKKNSDPLPRLSGGILKGEYVFDNVHFHCDSEHIIYGKSYPLEAHFVHYRVSMGCMETAKASKLVGSIAIISIVYEVYENECTQWADFDALTCFSGSNTLESYFCLRDLLPPYLRSYYTYKDCQCGGGKENIRWIIMAVPGIITRSQYKSLTSVCSKNTIPCHEVAKRDLVFVINGYVKRPRGNKKAEENLTRTVTKFTGYSK